MIYNILSATDSVSLLLSLPSDGDTPKTNNSSSDCLNCLNGFDVPKELDDILGFNLALQTLILNVKEMFEKHENKIQK